MTGKNRLILILASLVAGLFTPRMDGSVVINEIHCAPRDKTVREEFVELYNGGGAPVDLSLWHITGGIQFAFSPGTTIGPGEYLVVAQDPAVLVGLYGDLPVVGPFSGRLGNEGDDVILRTPDGRRHDEVDYQRGFPWPTAGGSSNYSMELIHPDLENDLGGSWRISNPAGTSEATALVAAGERWKYLEGTAEASSPVSAWRQPGFDDSSWKEGDLSIGYGETFIRTTLAMQGSYISVFLRKEFDVADPAAAGSLALEAQYDDGFNAWINGVHVATANLASAEVAHDAAASSALESYEFEEFKLPRPVNYLVPGRNVLAVQLHNSSLSGSSDAFIDVRLTASTGAGSGPTPGAQNSVFAANAPPQLRQVEHLPEVPSSGSTVLIHAKATDPDGVAGVSVSYQVVEPGAYVRLEDPAYETGWTTAAMRDDGSSGDAIRGDSIYTARLPEALQVHRRLVRYRITATDGTGLSVTVPYPDDPQPNFAYFAYDGVPGWKGASRPGVTPVHEFSPEVMSSLPVYHLIAREQDVINSQYSSSYENVHFHGTLVHEGVVHDHMEFENRGEYSTYVSGKNKWRFHLKRGHEFQARDDHGKKYKTRWQTMNFSAAASPWVPSNRGMAGLDEAAAFKLYSLAGVLSPKTNFVHFRVIDRALEASATDQYEGDLWGLYLTIEHTDGRFLDERSLPDGNTYKIEGGNGDKRNQGPTQSTDSSDYVNLRNGYNQSQTISWWRANVDLHGYYGFRSVGRAINDMDLREGWNVCQYHDPETNLWSVMPWDLDMLYMPVTHWSGVMSFQNAITQHQEILREFQSRARELMDLLFTEDQVARVVGELAARENPPGWPLTFVDVDEAMWNYHPRTASSHRGAFYKNPSTHSAIGGTINRTLVSADHEGMVRWLEDFVLQGYGYQQLAADAQDVAIPNQPSAVAVGDLDFPIDDLVFRAGPFSDPQGGGTFGGMKWRVAEVAPQGAPPFDPENPKPFEVNADWESEELPTFQELVTIPPEAVKIGGTYRVRVRMKDNTNRWSRWSPPVEFTTSEPLAAFPPQAALRITEIMYHPPEGSDHEFIELQNVGAETLDLSDVSFTRGIEFRFAEGDVPILESGEFVLVVNDRLAFSGLHDASNLRIAGEFSGNLENAGEGITLTYGRNATILDFFYSDDWQPLTDGYGWSLVPADPLAPADVWGTPAGWRQSSHAGGSPGAADGSSPAAGRQLPGDSNQDGSLDISDALSLLLRLFLGGAPPPCEGLIGEGGNAILLDINGDGAVNVSDPVYLLGYLFRSGASPVRGVRCILIPGCPDACGS